MARVKDMFDFIKGWVTGTVTSGLYSAVSIRHGVLYSYDEPIAAKHPKLANVAWVTGRQFSVSTNRHTRDVMQALQREGISLVSSLELPVTAREWARVTKEAKHPWSFHGLKEAKSRALKYEKGHGGRRNKSPVPVGWWREELKRRREAKAKETLKNNAEW